MTNIKPMLIKFPWFTLYGMPSAPGRLARLRCGMAMLVHELVELVAGSTTAHSMRSANRFQIGAPTITVPASERNRLFFTTIADGYPEIYGDLIDGRTGVECRMFASGTVDSNFELIYNPGELIEISISNPATGNWEKVGGNHGHGYGLGWPQRIKEVLHDSAPIAVLNSGVWDSDLVECGPVLWDDATEQWIATWTGRGTVHVDPLVDGFQGSRIGAALSVDGFTWTQHPQNPITGEEQRTVGGEGRGAEDPFIAKTVDGKVWRDSDGCAHMYVEQKLMGTQIGLSWYKSGVNTLNDWVFQDQIITAGTVEWNEYFCASPVTIVDGSTMVMVYEGLDNVLHGDIGVALSMDEGVTWDFGTETKLIERVPDTWYEKSLVADDAILVDDKWILLCHGSNNGDIYRVGRFVTTDSPADWGPGSFTPMDETFFSTSNTVHCWGNDPTAAIRLNENDTELRRLIIAPIDFVTTPEAAEAFDPSALESSIGSLESRADDLETADVAVDGRILNTESDIMRAFLATGRTAPSTTIEAFAATTGDFGGTPPDAVILTIPASLTTPALPWINIGSQLVSLASSSPTAPSSEHRLTGVKVRVTATGIDQLTDIQATILFGGAYPCKVGSLGAWGSNTENGANLDPAHADVAVEQDVVLLLDEPIASGDLSSMLLVAGFVVSGESPSIGTGATLDFPTEPEWLWDTDIASGSATLNEVVGLGIAGTHTLTEAGAYTIQDGGTITLPSAASMPGAEVSVQHITSSGGGGTLTVNPFSGEYMQRGWGNDSFTTSSLVIDTDAMMIWRAATAAGFGVDAWVLVSLDYQGESGTVDVISNVATGTIIGRATASSGDSEELSPSQARTVMELGSAALADSADFATPSEVTSAANAAEAAAIAASQPVDSDLTSIAALTTTAYGRAFLELANQAALLALLHVVPQVRGCPRAVADDWVLLSTPYGTGSQSVATGGAASSSSGKAIYVPFTIDRAISITGLGIEVSTGNAGGSAVLRMGVHSDTSGRPGAVVVDTTTTATAAAKEATFSSTALAPGNYWAVLAFQSLDTAGTNPLIRGALAMTSSANRSAVVTGANQAATYTATVSGALAANPTVSLTTPLVPNIWMKVGTP